MTPLTKKQKIATMSQLETIVSASTMDEATVANSPEAQVTAEQINAMLRNLRNSDTVDHAVDAMKALFNKIDTNVKDLDKCEAAAKLIVELEGVGTIHSALKDWSAQSGELSYFALNCLISITCFVEKTRITLVRIGGIKTILSAINEQKDCLLVRANVVRLLGNIAATDDNEINKEVAIDQCVDFVLEMMRILPSVACIQESGCNYFYNISTVDNIKGKLRAKGVCSMLGNVIDTFIDSDEDEEKHACNAAQRTFDEYRKP